MPFSFVYKGVFVGMLPTCKVEFENDGCGTTNTYRGAKLILGETLCMKDELKNKGNFDKNKNAEYEINNIRKNIGSGTKNDENNDTKKDIKGSTKKDTDNNTKDSTLKDTDNNTKDSTLKDTDNDTKGSAKNDTNNDINEIFDIDKSVGRILRTDRGNVLVLNIFGEIEGHENLPGTSKATSYEKLLPVLVNAEGCQGIAGIMLLINTLGGDVEGGLAISETVASLSKPSVSLVLGGSHSIGVPLAASCDVSFIVPTATVLIHPIRVSNIVLGVKQNFDYIERMQDRIIDFTCSHSKITREDFKRLMFNTGELTKDVGTVLVGEAAVKAGVIDMTGGISQALKKLYDLIN
jgi:ATP-dependent protease ClpP protease subunit